MASRLQKLVVLHTNDIHSHFEPMPKIATIIRQHREQLSADELLVIDCGDHLDRAYVETEGSDGAANIAVLNATGYDVAVPGNNEGLTFSMETMQTLYSEQAKFPVLGGNMHQAATGQLPDWILSSLILRKNDLRIGLIGVTIDFMDFYRLLGWDVRNPFATVAQLVGELREQVHIVILISHLGLPYDERIAREIDGIDCILGGHTHHLLERPITVGRTTICGAGKFGTHIGRLEITYDHDAGAIVQVEGKCLATDQVAPADDIERLIAQYRRISEINLGRVVTTLHEDLEIDWHQESRLGNLLALGLREWCGAEIGIVNTGQLLDGLRSGDVTRRKLLAICPSPINPCRMTLRGAEIKEALRQSLLIEYQDMPIRGYGFRGNVLGSLCVSGLKIEVNAESHSIDRILLHGRELTDDQDVVVGTIDMFTFDIGYRSLSRGRNIQFFLPEFLRDILLAQLCDTARIAMSAERHWIFKDRH